MQAAGLGLNGWLWWRNRKLASRSGTPLIEMQWRTNRADALSNLAVLVALILSLSLRLKPWHVYIDPVCALVFVLYAAASFIPTIRDGIQDLIDKTLPEELQIKILRHLAENFDGYEAFHGVRSRRVGHRIFIDISLSFSPDKTVGEAMDTIDRLRKNLEQDIPKSDVNIVLKSLERLNLSQYENTEVKILPLSTSTLAPVLELIHSSFNLTHDEEPDLELEESLSPGKYTARLARIGISDPRYWVAFHNRRILGVAGFYFRPDDRHEAVWGWMDSL